MCAGWRFNATRPQSCSALGTRIHHRGSFIVVQDPSNNVPRDRSRITLFAQGATYCAVCAPLEVGADTIEAEVALRNCAIARARWKIAVGSMIDGRPNPQPARGGATPLARDACPWLVTFCYG